MGNVERSTLLDLHKSIESGAEFMYKGRLNFEILNSLLEILNDRFEDMEVPYVLRKRMYVIATECLENVIQHQKEEKGDAIFVLGKEADEFYLATGNLVSSGSFQAIEENLDQIQSSGKQELRYLMRRRLSNSAEEESEEGIGLIDIALKSKNKIDYDMRELTNEKGFFSLKVNLTI